MHVLWQGRNCLQQSGPGVGTMPKNIPSQSLGRQKPRAVLTRTCLPSAVVATLSFSMPWLTEITGFCFVRFCYYCYFFSNNFRQWSENSRKLILCEHLIKCQDNNIMNMYVLWLSLLHGMTIWAQVTILFISLSLFNPAYSVLVQPWTPCLGPLSDEFHSLKQTCVYLYCVGEYPSRSSFPAPMQ